MMKWKLLKDLPEHKAGEIINDNFIDGYNCNHHPDWFERVEEEKTLLEKFDEIDSSVMYPPLTPSGVNSLKAVKAKEHYRELHDKYGAEWDNFDIFKKSNISRSDYIRQQTFGKEGE